MKKRSIKQTKHPTRSGLLVLIIGYGCAFILNLLHYGTSNSLLDTTLRFSVIAIVSTGASLILSPFLKKLKVKGAKYLQVQIKHTFPTVQNQGISYRSSLLARGVEDHIGLLWAESTNRPQLDTKIHFFQVYLQSETMIHTDISWESWVNDLLLQYDTDGKRWIACLDHLALYQVELQQEPRFTELTEIAPEYHSAPLRAILLNQWQHYYHLLYLVGNSDEVSDWEAHWSTYKSSSFEKEQSIFLSHCDTATGFHLLDRYFLFLCKRVYNQEPTHFPRVGAGHWQLSLQVYDMQANRLNEYAVIEEDVLIRFVKEPHWDLSRWLDLCICVTEGPIQLLEERPTCVAAMILYEAAELPRTESGDEIDALWQNPHRHTNYTEVGGQQHGGLFWFDYNGQCLQQSTSRVGAQISMCCCGERIIGVDHIPERWRVWTWLPTDTQEIQECLILDTTITRATVVAQSGEDESGGLCFWLVEEYEHGVKVSLRANTTCAEEATIWLEGVMLPDGPYEQYLYSQRKPAGVLPYNGTLLLLGFDKQKQLTLFQISV